MKRIRIETFIFAAIISIFSSTLLLKNSPAYAVSASEWNASNIIDDAAFYDNTSMSTADIQAFLNSKNPSCDTQGTRPASEYGRSDLTHAQYAAMVGWPGPPYVCLRDYFQVPRSDENINNLSTNIKPEGSISAAEIIKRASDTYGVSPKVLLVLIQKESVGPLLTDTWPIPAQYRSVVGYACPDTAPCDPKYAGFYNQIMNAAYQFKYYKDHAFDKNIYGDYIYNHQPYNTVALRFNPNASCGYTQTRMDNYATTGLYNYTPYQPNQAALNNMYGTGDGCSAYGNRNFWRMFSDWFGSTRVSSIYTWAPVSQALYTDSGRTVKLAYNATLEPGQKVYMRIQAKNTGNQTWTKSTMKLATFNAKDRSSVFRGDDWFSANRVTGMLQDEVKPGDIATFEASFITPQELADYKEYFNLVVEGVTWLNDPGLYIPVSVRPSRELLLYSDAEKTVRLNNANLSIYAGTKLYGRIKVTNNTNISLPGAARLATTNPNDRPSSFQDTSWISSNRVALLNKTLEHGEAGFFDFTIKTPQEIGNYTESFGIVIDGTGGRWVETTTATFAMNVKERPKNHLSTNENILTEKLIISTDSRYLLLVQGDGNLVIYKNNGKTIWASGTAGRGAAKLVMQDDGNLVAYTANGAIWASGTAGR